MRRARGRRFTVPALALLSAALLVALVRPAYAAVTCSATMTGVTFGNVNPLGGSVDVTATIVWTCARPGTLLGLLTSVMGTMCLGIGSGVQGAGNYSPRQMLSGANIFQFQLYRDAARSQIVGPVGGGSYLPFQFTFHMPILALFQTSYATGSATVYGRIPAGQTNVLVGSYQNIFSGGHTKLSFQYNEALLNLGGYPASCESGGQAGGGTGTFPFTVAASVQPACTVSASDHDFGNVGGFLDTSHDGTSAISLQCTNGAAWKVGLDNGQHASGATRRMSGSGGLVTYELYRDNGRTQRWGNAAPDWSTGTGSGTTQNLTVYGRVPAQAARAAGTYTDVVTVNVIY